VAKAAGSYTGHYLAPLLARGKKAPAKELALDGVE
jgi:hypothetical protein